MHSNWELPMITFYSDAWVLCHDGNHALVQVHVCGVYTVILDL